jgi:hypothetical protein
MDLSNYDHGQEIIPTTLLSRTECKRIISREGCQFGRNWNNFKMVLIKGV